MLSPHSLQVSLDPYRRESLKILAIFKEVVPKGEIGTLPTLPTQLPLTPVCLTEKASIDEAFIDLSLMVVERLLERHPYLASVPDDAPEGLDSLLPSPPPINWTTAGNVFPIEGEGKEGGDSEPQKDEHSEDEEVELDTKRGDSVSWEDWALFVGAELMGEVRAEVWKRLHYTCSAVCLEFHGRLRTASTDLHSRVLLITSQWPRYVSLTEVWLIKLALLRLEEAKQPDRASYSCNTGVPQRYGLH